MGRRSKKRKPCPWDANPSTTKKPACVGDPQQDEGDNEDWSFFDTRKDPGSVIEMARYYHATKSVKTEYTAVHRIVGGESIYRLKKFYASSGKNSQHTKQRKQCLITGADFKEMLNRVTALLEAVEREGGNLRGPDRTGRLEIESVVSPQQRRECKVTAEFLTQLKYKAIWPESSALREKAEKCLNSRADSCSIATCINDKRVEEFDSAYSELKRKHPRLNVEALQEKHSDDASEGAQNSTAIDIAKKVKSSLMHATCTDAIHLVD